MEVRNLPEKTLGVKAENFQVLLIVRKTLLCSSPQSFPSLPSLYNHFHHTVHIEIFMIIASSSSLMLESIFFVIIFKSGSCLPSPLPLSLEIKFSFNYQQKQFLYAHFKIYNFRKNFMFLHACNWCLV